MSRFHPDSQARDSRPVHGANLPDYCLGSESCPSFRSLRAVQTTARRVWSWTLERAGGLAAQVRHILLDLAKISEHLLAVPRRIFHLLLQFGEFLLIAHIPHLHIGLDRIELIFEHAFKLALDTREEERPSHPYEPRANDSRHR